MKEDHNILQGKKVAILVADGFEQIEMTEPRRHLEDAGAETVLISAANDTVTAWDETDWGDTYNVDLELENGRVDDFDALLLPGGVMSPDRLRMDERAVRFVREFFLAAKPVAAICHGPWMLIDANVAKGRTLTSYPSIKVDLTNAGAKWLDQEVVIDEGLVTSRRPSDLPAFNRAMIGVFARGHYDMQRLADASKPVPAAR